MLFNNDCFLQLKEFDDNSIDSLITDPPAGISFMNKKWDDDKGGRDAWIQWMSDIMKECLRVLKPGAHGLVWALPRTSHWTATALENAGFEVRDIVTHLFGTGFPKSNNISKSIDKELGIEREIIGSGKYSNKQRTSTHNSMTGAGTPSINEIITKPGSNEAKKYDGWGTALKPASEHWILIRKPLEEKTVAKNVLKYGTGGINIDESRISIEDPEKFKKEWDRKTITNIKGNKYNDPDAKEQIPNNNPAPSGRWPANLVLSHNEDCKCIGIKEIKHKGGVPLPTIHDKKSIINFTNRHIKYTLHFNQETGKETVQNWNCTEGCAVKMLDEQSGILHSRGNINPTNLGGGLYGHSIFKGIGFNDHISGGASRFFATFKGYSECGVKNIKEEDISVGKKKENKKDNLNTDGFGNNNLEKYLMGSISITKTKTNLIMTFPILNVLKHTVIGICTLENEKIIESLTDVNIECVNVVSNTKALIILKDGHEELIKGTVSIVLLQNLENGDQKIENITTSITENIEQNVNRFFYCAKASKSDKGTDNTHPTVKNTKLMEYLIKLITPESGIILDPFMGSGSIGVAAKRMGFEFVGIEKEKEYFDIAEGRIESIILQPTIFDYEVNI